MKKLLTLLGIIFLFILFPSTVLATPVGTFTHIEGRVDITSPGEAARSAMLGDEVNVGDIIRTKSKAKAEVTFVDGNILRLAESTRMEITEYLFDKERTSGTLKLYRGKIQNKVKRLLGRVFGLGKKNRFEVRTPTAVVGVRGTDFFTYYKQGISGSIFREGEGYCYSVNQPDQVKNINAGQAMVVVSPDLPPTIKPATDPEVEQHIQDTAPTKEEAGEEEAGEEEKQEADAGPSSEGTGIESDVDVLASESSTDIVVGDGGVDGGVDVGVDGGVDDLGGLDIPPDIPTDTREVTTITGPITGTGFSAIFSASIYDPLVPPDPLDPLENTGTMDISSGSFTSPPEGNVWEGTIQGDMSDGGKTWGVFAGILGSWHGLFGSLYVSGVEDVSGVEPEYMAGYIFADLSGTFNLDNLTFSGSGEANRKPMGSTVITPDLLDSSLIFDSFEGLGAGSFTGGGSLDATFAEGENIRIDGHDWGLWNAGFGGTYSGQTSNQWTFITGGDYYGSYGYWIGHINGTSWGNPDIFGTYSATALTDLYLYNFTGHILGTHIETGSSGEWQAAGIGKSSREPLKFNGMVTSGGFGGWDDAQQDVIFPSPLFGLIGGTDSLFSGFNELTSTYSSDPFIGLGNYNPATSTDYSLFGALIDGGGPIFGVDGFYKLLIGGIADESSGGGKAVGLYTRPDGTGTYEAGILESGTISGISYPGIGMWEIPLASNTLTAQRKSTGLTSLPILVESAAAMPAPIVGDNITGYGRSDSASFYVNGQEEKWGIWVSRSGGTHDGTLTPGWQALTGWTELDGSGMPESAIVRLTNTDWSWGRATGTAQGRFLNLYNKGDINGEFLGVYDASTWESLGIGTWQGEPLSFVSDIDYAELKSTDDRYNGRWNSPSDSSYYYYEYNEDKTYGYTEHYIELAGSSTSTRYFTDGTTSTYDSSTGSWSYGTWDPDTFDLASLANQPDPAYTLSYSYDHPYTFYWAGYLGGLLGGTGSLWTATSNNPASLTMMGTYYENTRGGSPNPIWYENDLSSYNFLDNNHTTYDGGAYNGFMGGIKLDDTLEGRLLALYIDPSGNAGILKGSLTGMFYPGIGMFEADGSIFPIQLIPGTGYSAVDLHSGPGGLINKTLESVPGGWPGRHGQFIDVSSGAPVLGGDIHQRDVISAKASIGDMMASSPWVLAVRSSILGGTYSEFGTTTFDHWVLSGSIDDGTLKRQWTTISSPDAPETDGSWSNGLISGKGSGAWVSWGTAVTGVSGADLKGTFDPTNHTWQASEMWAAMDTNTFLGLTATSGGREKLAELNIPCIEIGRADLVGSNTFAGGTMSVNMQDVTFFTYSTGTIPRIWATNQVDGNFTGTPNPINWTVPLTGTNISNTSGLSADFQLKRWDTGTNQWGANINNGNGMVNNKSIYFNGGAAGMIDSAGNKFAGTGSGKAGLNTTP